MARPIPRHSCHFLVKARAGCLTLIASCGVGISVRIVVNTSFILSASPIDATLGVDYWVIWVMTGDSLHIIISAAIVIIYQMHVGLCVLGGQINFWLIYNY